ncbi:hypothetical protein AB3N59_11640 [Leptospira sp. WS92.C1]
MIVENGILILGFRCNKKSKNKSQGRPFDYDDTLVQIREVRYETLKSLSLSKNSDLN